MARYGLIWLYRSRTFCGDALDTPHDYLATKFFFGPNGAKGALFFGPNWDQKKFPEAPKGLSLGPKEPKNDSKWTFWPFYEA